MIAEAQNAPVTLEDLTRRCEDGFAEVRDTNARTVTAVDDRETIEPSGGLHLMGDVVVSRTYHVVQLTNGYACPDGQDPHFVEMREDALRLFWEGWQRYRAETPGETLIWRTRPYVWTIRDPAGRQPTRYSCIARLVIIDTEALREEARRAKEGLQI